MTEQEPASTPVEQTPSPTPPAEEPASPPEEGQTGRSVDWLRQAFRGYKEEKTEEPTETKPTAEEKPEEKATEKEQQPATLTLTQDEVLRLVQSETDRREAVRLARARRTEMQRLREQDPDEFARQSAAEEKEQLQFESQQQQFHTWVREWDSSIINPVLQEIPARDAVAIVESNPDGMTGRTKIVQSAITLIKKQAFEKGKSEAASALRKDKAFRKELLAELRGEGETPTSVEGTPTAGSFDMNDTIRRMAGRSRQPVERIQI